MARCMSMVFKCPKCDHLNKRCEFGTDPTTEEHIFFVTCSGVDDEAERCHHKFQIKATHEQLVGQARQSVTPTSMIQIPDATLERYPVQ